MKDCFSCINICKVPSEMFPSIVNISNRLKKKMFDHYLCLYSSNHSLKFAKNISRILHECSCFIEFIEQVEEMQIKKFGVPTENQKLNSMIFPLAVM